MKSFLPEYFVDKLVPVQYGTVGREPFITNLSEEFGEEPDKK
jgi:hypothetical protein